MAAVPGGCTPGVRNVVCFDDTHEANNREDNAMIHTPTATRLAAAVLALLAFAPASRSGLDGLRAEFANPPREHCQYAFWFWNGELTEAGIREQIEWMDNHGMYGFCIHARMGLSETVGYMTDRWLELARFAVEEAERRDMGVYLYDEGMYPSGSAHGEVVKGHPELASQGLRMETAEAAGPGAIALPFETGEGESLAALVLAKPSDGDYNAESARAVELDGSGRVPVPAGEWTLYGFIQTPSGGVIRGVHWDEEDNKPGAPPSADLLNPAATARFIEKTHQCYYNALAPHFGKTVLGIFTDEPSILGRRSKRGLRPWTIGFLGQINDILGYDFTPMLPLLWLDAPDGLARAARQDFEFAVAETLNEHYYRPISEWCEAHGVALTGHPSGGGEMRPQVYFHQPGQDVVWRWVLPGETALEGEQSTVGKSASSMAVHLERPIVINECFGAFGWQLTMDEMKWLSDWLFVRGANRLFPHAVYYSVEGARIYERPPDVAWNNLWAEHYGLFTQYTNRLSWLMAGGVPVADTAILCLPGHTPWRAARVLFENQRDFYYLDDSLLDSVKQVRDRIHIGSASYNTLVLDGIHYLPGDVAAKLRELWRKGLTIIALDSELGPNPRLSDSEGGDSNPPFIQTADEGAFLREIEKHTRADIQCDPPAPDLRYTHRVKDGVHLYLMTNEGNESIETTVTFAQKSVPELWDAETGETGPAPGRLDDGKFRLPLTLPPSQSRILAFDPEADLTPAGPVEGETLLLYVFDQPWTLEIDGETLPARLGSWTDNPALEKYSGTGWYSTGFELDGKYLENAERVVLDCGVVREWIRVEVNGADCGVRLWRPFEVDITDAVKPGLNRVRIGVTNTRANELTRESLPSGLFGPVRLEIAR